MIDSSPPIKFSFVKDVNSTLKTTSRFLRENKVTIVALSLLALGTAIYVLSVQRKSGSYPASGASGVGTEPKKDRPSLIGEMKGFTGVEKEKYINGKFWTDSNQAFGILHEMIEEDLNKLVYKEGTDLFVVCQILEGLFVNPMYLEQTFKLLERIKEHPDADCRVRVAGLLGGNKDSEFRNALQEMKTDKEEKVRRAVSKALGLTLKVPE
jgi:hypothetical protein